jgi:hypothetical protein
MRRSRRMAPGPQQSGLLKAAAVCSASDRYGDAVRPSVVGRSATAQRRSRSCRGACSRRVQERSTVEVALASRAGLAGGLKVTLARTRPGLRLAADDRDSRGSRFARRVSFPVPLARRSHRGAEVLSSDDAAHTPRDAKRTTTAARSRAGWEPRIARLENRLEHLEAALEGLDDAVYRQSVLECRRIAELGRRTEPHQMARALSEDARRRGV